MLLKIARKFFESLGISLKYTTSLQDCFCNITVTGRTLVGKTVMISGATGDIGKALIKRFLLEGCHVIMVARAEHKLLSLKEEFEKTGSQLIDYIVCDLSDLSSVKKIKTDYFNLGGSVDVLINNAGIFGGAREKKFRGVTKETFTLTINTNLKSAALLSELVINKMIQEGKEGVIVNMSSICSQFNSFRYSPYGISKAGLIGLTTDINAKYRENHIIAHAILPGSVATKMGNLKVGDNIAGNNNVLNRSVLAEEVASIAAVYSSDIGKYCKTNLVASAWEIL